MEDTICSRFEVIVESLRRRLRERVPKGGRDVGRTDGDEIRDRNSSSPAKRSGGLNAVER
jgi:hypothetical protein